MKIRLARGGSKKRPFYRIVAADSRMPRDGRYIERLGTYNPLLAKDSEERVKMNMERIQYWLGEGAQPTDRISRMLEAAGILEKKLRTNLKKGEPGQKAKDRVEQKAAKLAEAEAAPEAPAEVVAEAPAEAEAAPPAEIVSPGRSRGSTRISSRSRSRSPGRSRGSTRSSSRSRSRSPGRSRGSTRSSSRRRKVV